MSTAEVSPADSAGLGGGDGDEFTELVRWWHTARMQHPVRFDEAQQAWELFGYDDITRALFDPKRFSSDFSGLAPAQEDIDLFTRGDFTGIDPPRHRQLRSLAGQAFTPRSIAALEPHITGITDALLDAVPDPGRFDFVDALADPLPIIVITELLGIPPDDRGTFRRWAAVLLGGDAVSGLGPDSGPAELAAAMEAVAPTVREMNEYLLAHIRRSRITGADDLTGRLIAAEVDGERLADEDILGFLGSLFSAGHVTVTALLSSLLTLLVEQPATAAALRADPELRAGAIEETLRVRPPFLRIGRRTTEAVEIGGVPIPAESVVMLWVGAANRDPSRFPDPDVFDVHRPAPNAHLTFGHGIHFCLGTPLARLTARIVLDRLFARYAELAVDPLRPIVPHNPWLIVGARRLPLLARPAGA
ncbi:MAG TPA: cytochrome P450 [Pseudonocardiaceae bacterium]|jgi:cytochrome P450|nr:cytochrome P450 [Pseudonocardiaceae bacterium]